MNDDTNIRDKLIQILEYNHIDKYNIFFVSHRPFYCTKLDEPECNVSIWILKEFEDILI